MISAEESWMRDPVHGAVGNIEKHIPSSVLLFTFLKFFQNSNFSFSVTVIVSVWKRACFSRLLQCVMIIFCVSEFNY